MIKNEFLDEIKANSGTITKKNAEIFLETFYDIVGETLASGEKVKITGLGTFKAVERDAMVKMNPKSGEPMDIEPTTVVKFKFSKKVKDLLSDS